MLEALRPTQDPDWVLSHEGYNVLTESAVESRFAFGNGFLGMRAARSISRGPTWVAWLGYSRWASWPRCYVAGLFDVPNIEPPVPEEAAPIFRVCCRDIDPVCGLSLPPRETKQTVA